MTARNPGMFVTFGSAETGEVGPTLGPYPFVQMTYSVLRAGEAEGDARDIAECDLTLRTGRWSIRPDDAMRSTIEDRYIGTVWTDVTIHNDPKDALA